METVDTGGPGLSLAEVLAGQAVGSWVVLDPDMTKVLGSAQTPEEALRRAGADAEPSAFDRVVGERPVMLQIPDPSLMCFY